MPETNINSWLEDELYQQYLHDHGAVDQSWRDMFAHNAPTNGATPSASAPSAAEPAPAGDLIPLRGIAARIAQNMEASLSIPLATSQRTISVRSEEHTSELQ